MGTGQQDNELKEALNRIEGSDKVKACEKKNFQEEFGQRELPIEASLLYDGFPKGYKETSFERDGSRAADEIQKLLNQGAVVESVEMEEDSYAITLNHRRYNNATIVYRGPFEHEESEDEEDLTQIDSEYSLDEIADIAEEFELVEAKEKAPFIPYTNIGSTEKSLPTTIWDPNAPEKSREDHLTRRGDEAAAELRWIADNRDARPISTEYDDSGEHFYLEFELDDRKFVYENPEIRGGNELAAGSNHLTHNSL